MIRSLTKVSIGLILSVTILSHSGFTKETSKSFRVIGYLPDYRMSTIPESWSKNLTDIIYFSIEPKASGEVDPSKLKLDYLQKLREFTKKNNQRLLICVGGWGKSGGFAPISKTKETRQIFIQNMLTFCKKHGFDGVDYDWEFPKNPKEAQAYSDLIVETKDAFRQSERLVTVAVGSMKKLTPEAYKALDFVHLMSYDHGGQHSTFEKSVGDVKRHLAFGVPKEKLCLGVPFYGRGIKNRHNTRTYAQIVQNYKPSPHTDQVAEVYFNGVKTIEKKTAFVLKQQLGGIMIWEIGQDESDGSSLLKAINRTIDINRPR